MAIAVHIGTEAETALDALGIPLDTLLDALRGGYRLRAECTGNDAPFFPALAQWNGTVRVLRDGLAPLGWGKSNDENYCLSINPENTIAIAVSSGCEETGQYRPGVFPTTKSPKGPSTASAVAMNIELMDDLFPETIAEPEVETEEGRITWLLLFRNDPDAIRAELSLPASMTAGKIDTWKERIILPPLPYDPTGSGIGPETGPDVDITVTRRL